MLLLRNLTFWVAVSVLVPSVAASSPSCIKWQKSDIITLQSWSAELSENGEWFSYSMTFRNELTYSGLRMVKATLKMEDVLGRVVLHSFDLPEDFVAGPGETVDHTDRIPAGWLDTTNLGRLLANPEDFRWIVCVDGVVFADGRVVKYEPN